MRSLLERLDRICEAINVWLIMVAIGLAVLVVIFGIVRLAPPAFPPHAGSVQ